MGFFKLFAGKSLEDVEKKADGLFEAGEYGLAQMEYDHGLDKLRKGAQGNEALHKRLKEKLRTTREILARKHKREGLEIMDSEYYEAAEESFRLALELTEDPELIQEFRGMLNEIKRRSGNQQAVPAFDLRPLNNVDSARVEPGAGDDEYLDALCSGLPEPVLKEFHP